MTVKYKAGIDIELNGETCKMLAGVCMEDTWKAWVEYDGDWHCVAITCTNQQAHRMLANHIDGYTNSLVTRGNTLDIAGLVVKTIEEEK